MPPSSTPDPSSGAALSPASPASPASPVSPVSPPPKLSATTPTKPAVASIDRRLHHRRNASNSTTPASSPAAAAAVSVFRSRHSEDDSVRHGLSKMLQKRRRDGIQHTSTMEFPERLKVATDGAEDEEVLRPNGQSNGVFMNLNQSIFGLIAAAGSTVNFNNRFEGQSSDEGDDEDDEDTDRNEADDDSRSHALDGTSESQRAGRLARKRQDGDSSADKTDKKDKRRSKDLSQSTIFSRLSGGSSNVSLADKPGDRHSRMSENRLLRSLPALKTRLSVRHSRKTSKEAGTTPSTDQPTGSNSSRSRSRIDEEDEEQDDRAPTPTPATITRTGAPTPAVTYVVSPVDSSPSASASASTSTRADAVPIDDDALSASVQALPRGERSNSVRSIAPVMSRMLEAKAELAARPSFDFDRRSSDRKRTAKDSNETDVDSDDAIGSSALARKLMEIFDFEKPEEVIEEYPCWLLQSVLLQGYMYITANHICFYAYLPKKANEVSKSGYLAKSGKRNPKYNRYWFRLKGDVLAYYRDPSNLYFPHGQIDLRYGISATVTDRDKDGVHFQVVTHHRTYYFRADSAPSAKEWVKSLQRVIFRSHNEGDSVKISLPIANVIDVEETQTVVEFADTCKIRVIDNDETYAIDEYFFSFFDYGKDAVRVLRILIEDANQQQQSPERGRDHTDRSLLLRLQMRSATSPQQSADDADESASASAPERGPSAVASASDSRILKATKLHSSVRATLSPVSPPSSPRASGEYPRSSFDALRTSFSGRRSLDTSIAQLAEGPPRRSFSDYSRRSLSTDRDRRPARSSRRQQQRHPLAGSTESMVPLSSAEDPSVASLSGLVVSSTENDQSSASQILHGSDIFKGPTIVHRSASASRRRDGKRASWQPSRTTGSARHFDGGRVGDSEHASSADSQTLPSDIATGGGTTTPGGTASLQRLAKMGSYPLQRAGAYAGWLNQQSRRMSSLLATESMGYVEKVSGMWKGGHRHYNEGPGPGSGLMRADEELDDDTAGMGGAGEGEAPDLAVVNERFRAHFALPETERLQATYFGYLMRVLPLYGKIYISDRSFCFRSLLPGTRTKLILPLRDIENVTKEKGFRFGFSGLVVVIRGHEELFFEFGQAEMRDDCAVTLLRGFESARYLRESGLLNEDEKAGAQTALAERDALQEARQASRDGEEGGGENENGSTPAAVNVMKLTESPTTILFDDPRASFLNFKPAEPLRITCLTIGSRGDVQPYIALGKGLQADGHHVRIATHPEFEGWIRSHGLDYGRVEGDPGELMRICIENGTFTLQFLREANSKMRTWLDELLASAWTACQDAELLIESPSAMAGIHIAERLQIPYFRAFTMPWTRTRAYPHAFIMPEHKMGGAYNYITYVMFDNIFWKATASQINRWRNKMLGLPNTTLEKMQPNKVPFLYNFSASVVPPPLDYSDWIRVTGYWFLDEGKKVEKDAKDENPPWSPPQDLVDFIAKARQDKKKLVYVGFGSILVPDPAKMTQEVIDAVLKADVRCVLSKGWSDRLAGDKDKDKEQGENNANDHDHTRVEVPLPPEMFQIKSAPHDWLFAQMDAAAHHGGSGTTGASLRAGIPTIIRPFFGDQFFFGGRVEDLGVGICLKKWGATSFARALWEAANSDRMIKKAAALGEQIRQENGVDTAIQCIYRDMEYAKSLVRAKAGKTAGHGSETGVAGRTAAPDDYEEEPEESWTFVGNDDNSNVHGTDLMLQSVILSPDGGKSGKALGSRVLGQVAV